MRFLWNHSGTELQDLCYVLPFELVWYNEKSGEEINLYPTPVVGAKRGRAGRGSFLLRLALRYNSSRIAQGPINYSLHTYTRWVSQPNPGHT
jgi:hypothetical protein